MTREERWGYLERVLTDTEVAEKGHVAAIDLATGEIVKMADADGLLPIGYFDESFTGDGTRAIRVRLFREIILHGFVNDADPNQVEESDVGNVAYFKDSQTVSMVGTDRSVAGRIWGLRAGMVLVEPAINIGLTGPQGEPGV
jgi:hypothetical protein